ncbi:MAG: hypothetical protein FWG87_04415 [Defluviitaleaceae bacterium]|nr:hypothetical protein [Defluviitaleaceae bacterium]
MPRLLISFTLISLLLHTAVFATNTATNTATIENSGQNRYKAVRLTPEVYNNANSTLSDLRITDSAGEYVPYFIRTGGSAEYETLTQTHPMTLVDSYTRDNNFYFDYKVSEIPTHDIVATSIAFSTRNTGFAKHIEIFGSYDGIHWQLVQSDSLYKIDDKAKLTIEFQTTQKYTHYRFKLGNNLERISFDSVTLLHSFVTQERIYFVDSISPEFSVEEKDGVTHIAVHGLKNLRLVDITINTNSMFKRFVNTSLGFGKELHSLTFGDTTYTDTTIPLNRQAPRNDSFTLTINNGDDSPISIDELVVSYYVDELVFEGRQGGEYTLHFGAGTANAPMYDIVRYKDAILREEIDTLRLVELSFAEAAETAPPRDYTLVFNIAVVGVAVVLGVVILLGLRGK